MSILKAKFGKGFTLIELLVVIAIIGLLASVALLALNSARSKARDTKRVSDVFQMHTALELYFSEYAGYPTSPGGVMNLTGFLPNLMTDLPSAPHPKDGSCPPTFSYDGLGNPVAGNDYKYLATGTPELEPRVGSVGDDYNYYFCIGGPSGMYGPGGHVMNATGIR